MCFNHRRTEIAVISSNGYIHCWDANRFKQIMSKKLPHSTENVCLAVDDDCSMYAVGSKANTDLLDSRTVTVSLSCNDFVVMRNLFLLYLFSGGQKDSFKKQRE